MSKITLIRHGQASFGADNYDLLSDIGRLQAAALGEYFLEHRIKFDTIIHGQMSRQTETAQIMAKSKNHSAELVLDKGADEFDSENLIKHYLPKLATISDDYYQIVNSEKKWFINGQNFVFVFKGLIKLWQQDQNCPFESWIDFRIRVIDLLNRIRLQYGTNKKIALVTSGGLISVTMQAILGLEEEKFVDLNLTINNASVSEIKMNEQNVSYENSYDNTNDNEHSINASLLCFNNISPLVLKKQPQLITRK